MEEKNSGIKKKYRCPYCGAISFSEAERKAGQMRALSGGNVALRCSHCHAEAKPRMKPLAWVIQGCIVALGLSSMIAFIVIGQVSGLDLSAWAVPWMIGSVAIIMLVLPARRPFMRVTRKGQFKNDLYEVKVTKCTRKDPLFDLYGVLKVQLPGVSPETFACVAVHEKKKDTAVVRLIPQDAPKLAPGQIIRTCESDGCEMELSVTKVRPDAALDR